MKKLPRVFLSRKTHNHVDQIFIRFTYNPELIKLIKQLNNVYWSASLKSWYLKNTTDNLLSINTVLKNKVIVHNNITFSKQITKNELTESQRTLLNNFYLYLKGKRYSKSTIKTYTFFVADFIYFNRKTTLNELNNKSVDIFIQRVFLPRNYSISTQRQFISALKVFIIFYPETKINNLTLERPKKNRKLPNVLSQQEVLSIIQATRNLKHRTILTLIYSCGLRISELINLKLSDFNIERKQLVIKNGKGRKDRYVNLADSFLPLLSAYYYTYNPKTYFIEGQNGNKYSAESVRQFLRKSCKNANIFKTVTPHTLRHSYATHLLENGVDIRYIQSLLRHARPETTMIYTHVQRKDLMNIQNPLDAALKKLNKTDNEKHKLLLSRNI